MARHPKYLENLIAAIRRAVKTKPVLTREDFERINREARARTGGQAKAERRQEPALEDESLSDSYEELIDELQEAVTASFGPAAFTVATSPDYVIYYLGNPVQPEAYHVADQDAAEDALSSADDAWEESQEKPDGDGDADDDVPFFRVQYTRQDDQIVFGTQEAVERTQTMHPVGESDAGEDTIYEEEIDELEEALYALYGSRCHILASYADHVVYAVDDANGCTMYDQAYSEDEATEKLTFGDKTEVEVETSWEPIAAEDGPSMISLVYKKAGASGSVASGKAKLPPNVMKMPANMQRMWVDVWNSTFAKTHNEKMAYMAANGVLKKRKGKSSKVVASNVPAPAEADWTLGGYTPSDFDRFAFTSVALSLDDAPLKELPQWVQMHSIGEWTVPHAGSGQKIRWTRAMGDEAIRNFYGNVVQRPIPLDERHQTDQGGPALGWYKDVRWGSPGQGLPHSQAPDGKGPILYGRVAYTDIGNYKLMNEHYKCISPQYDLNYRDNKTGKTYGVAFVAAAATNNPFLRQRTIQGDYEPEIAMLEDGIRTVQEDRMSAEDTLKLEELEQQLKAANERAAAQEERIKLAELREQRLAAERHEEKVVAFLDNEIRAGLPPALARMAKPIMLGAEPEREGTITLSDDADAPKVNLFEAMRTLVTEIPKLSLGARSLQQESRPVGATSLDDEMKDPPKDLIHSMLLSAGIIDSNGKGVGEIPSDGKES